MAPKKEEIKSIEELVKEEKIPTWQVAGVMAANNWASGKILSLSELKEALNSFLKGSMTGINQPEPEKPKAGEGENNG